MATNNDDMNGLIQTIQGIQDHDDTEDVNQKRPIEDFDAGDQVGGHPVLGFVFYESCNDVEFNKMMKNLYYIEMSSHEFKITPNEIGYKQKICQLGQTGQKGPEITITSPDNMPIAELSPECCTLYAPLNEKVMQAVMANNSKSTVTECSSFELALAVVNEAPKNSLSFSKEAENMIRARFEKDGVKDDAKSKEIEDFLKQYRVKEQDFDSNKQCVPKRG